MPEQPGWILLALAGLSGIGYAVADLIPWSMLGDVIDEDELESGERRDGLYAGFFTFLRKLGGATGVAMAGFALEGAGFVRGVDNIFFYHPESGQPRRILPCKLSCETCRTPIADEGRRMFLAFGPLFDFGHPPLVPPAFRPTCHIFYGARVIDVDDGLPKYLGHKENSPPRNPEGVGGA